MSRRNPRSLSQTTGEVTDWPHHVTFESTKRYGAQHCQGKRSQFIGVLGTEALLLGVKFRYDSEVTGFTDSQTPAVILRGGEIVRGDAVVVCDGSRSVSRALLAAPGVPPVPRRSSGYSIFRAIVNVNNGLRNDPLCGRELGPSDRSPRDEKS